MSEIITKTFRCDRCNNKFPNDTTSETGLIGFLHIEYEGVLKLEKDDKSKVNAPTDVEKIVSVNRTQEVAGVRFNPVDWFCYDCTADFQDFMQNINCSPRG